MKNSFQANPRRFSSAERALTIPAMSLSNLSLLSWPLRFTLLAAVLGLTGCFSASDEQVSAGKELLTTPALPEEAILQNATDAYDRGLFTLAKDSWTQLRDGYSNGPFAQLAELKIADSNFFAGDYPAAVASYEEFLRLHPQHEAAPYVQFQIGRAYQEQSRGDDRDPTPVKQALNAFEQLKSRYPDSSYVEQATRKAAECEELLETHQRLIAEFYERTGRPEAAKKRFEELAAKKREVKALRSTKKIEEQTLLGSQGLISSEDLPEGQNEDAEVASSGVNEAPLTLTSEGETVPPPSPREHMPIESAAATAKLKAPAVPLPIAIEAPGRTGPIPIVSNELLADLRCEQIAGLPVVTLLYRKDMFSTGRKLPKWSVVDQGSQPASFAGSPQKVQSKQMKLPTGGAKGLAEQQLSCTVGALKVGAIVSGGTNALMTLNFPSTITPVIVPLDRPYRLMLLFRTSATQKSVAERASAENEETDSREPVEDREF